MKNFFLALLTVCSFEVVQLQYASAVSITTLGSAYMQNFDSMGATGTMVPAGWRVGTTANSAGSMTDPPVTTGNYSTAGTTVVAGTGSLGTGNNYNFGSSMSSDRALGSVASNSLQRDTYIAFTNNTGLAISNFAVSYDGEQWRNGGAKVTNVLTLQFSTDGLNFTNMGAAFNFSSLQNSTPGGALDGNAAANRQAGIGGTYTPGLAILNGATFYLRWADPDDGGADDGLAIDNFSLTAYAPTAVPESFPTFAGLLCIFGALIFSRRFVFARVTLARQPGR